MLFINLVILYVFTYRYISRCYLTIMEKEQKQWQSNTNTNTKKQHQQRG